MVPHHQPRQAECRETTASPPRPSSRAFASPSPLSPPNEGDVAAHAALAWAALYSPEAPEERRLSRAVAGVADPAARIARTICVLSACAHDHREALAAQAPAFSDSLAMRGLKSDVASVWLEGRLEPLGHVAAALAAEGVARTVAASALDNASLGSPTLTHDLLVGLLRALGLTDMEAFELAHEAAVEVAAAARRPAH